LSARQVVRSKSRVGKEWAARARSIKSVSLLLPFFYVKVFGKLSVEMGLRKILGQLIIKLSVEMGLRNFLG
jgi:hypothetical protein